MSIKNINYIDKIEIINFLNESYFNIISQINIITIHLDKLNDVLLKDKIISLNTDYINRNKEISQLINNLKTNYQDHYLKLNEKIKTFDSLPYFSEKIHHNSQPSTNEEETSRLNSNYKSIFQNFDKIDKLTNDINKFREIKKIKRNQKLKDIELKIGDIFDEMTTLNFNQMNIKLKNLEVDNLFDEINNKFLNNI